MRAGAASPFGAPARILLALLVCLTAGQAAAQAPAAPDPAVIANLAAAFPDASPQEIAAMAGAAPAPAATGASAPAAAAPAATPIAQPSAAPAAVADGPVPNRGYTEPLQGATGAAPDIWMSIALVLAGALGGMTVATVAFLLFRSRAAPVDEDGLRRHHELLARIAQIEQRGAQAPEAHRPVEGPPPGIVPPMATLTRRLGEISARFNTIAALPELSLQAYLDAFAEYGTAYVAKVGPGGQVTLAPEVYAGDEGVELVAMALRDDAAALVPSHAWLARLRADAPTPDRAGEQVSAAFSLRADGSGRLSCSRPAVVEGGPAGLRLLPGQLSGFV